MVEEQGTEENEDGEVREEGEEQEDVAEEGEEVEGGEQKKERLVKRGEGKEGRRIWEREYRKQKKPTTMKQIQILEGL